MRLLEEGRFLALTPSRPRWRSHGPDLSEIRLAAYADAGLSGIVMAEDDPQLDAALNDTTPLLAFSPSPATMQRLTSIAHRRPVVLWLSARHALDHRRWTTACSTSEAALLAAENRAPSEQAKEIVGAVLASGEIHTVVGSEWLGSLAAFDSDTAPEQLHVIPEPLDPRRPRGWRRSSLQRLLAVGDFSAPGQNDLLVASITHLSQSDAAIAITLRGCGEWFDSETELLRHLPRVDLQKTCSSAPQMLALYQDHDALLYLSRVGARAFAVSDAMAAGLAVITHEVGAVKEYADPSSAVLLAQANSPREAAEAVLALRNDTIRFRDISGQAVNRAELDRGAEATTAREIELIRSLL